MFRPGAALVVASLLAGCLSPLDQCLWDAGGQAREIRAELDERRANLARGYRIERRELPVFPRFCTDPVTGAVYGCTDWVPEVEIRHRPIHPEYERERIALLERQLSREERRAAEAAAQCRATYPVG
jgi:hypothetical protein